MSSAWIVAQVFDSEEFRDMEIEATAETEPSMEDA